MAQENYVEVCSMQRPPLLEPNGFCFWKARFETYVKSKDIDLWQVIQNDDFYYEVEDSTTKLIKEHPDYSSKNHVIKFLCALPLKWRAKVTTIEEANDLATLPIDKLIEGSGKDKDEEEAEEFNLMARNFQKFFRKGNRFGCANRFGNGVNRFGRGCGNSFGKKGDERSNKMDLLPIWR
ncbi:hypothetical protein Tco_0869957 [Tanacetum coccineum]